MKKLVLAATVAALAVAGPAQAHKGSDDGADEKPGNAQAPGAGAKEIPGLGGLFGEHRHGDRPDKCAPRRTIYVAFGAYVSSTLTQTKGADTADNPRDDRYSGTVTIDVKFANKAGRADKGTRKAYTLTDARVRFADRNDDDTRDQPVAGDRTIVLGSTTKLRRRCDQTGFTPTLTVARVMFLPPRAEKPAPTVPAPTPPA